MRVLRSFFMRLGNLFQKERLEKELAEDKGDDAQPATT